MPIVTHLINKGLEALRLKKRQSNTFCQSSPGERDRWTRMCETYASHIRFEHPKWSKSKIWQHAEKRTRSKVKELMEKQEEEFLNEMISDTDSERSEEGRNMDQLQSKAPINECNSEDNKTIKNLLTSMKLSKDLSYQLMNPIIKKKQFNPNQRHQKSI